MHDGRAPDVGLRRPGHRQPVRRHHGRGSADPRRLVGVVRVPAAKRRHRAAGGAASRFIRVLRPVEVREGEGDNLKWARLEPYHGFKLSFEIEFDHRVVDSTGQRVEFDMGSGHYKRDIARARTFGFTKDVEMMRASGLALGGGMDNADRDGRLPRAQRRRPALRRRVRQAQDPRRDRRPVRRRPAAAGRLQRLPVRATR